MDLKTRTANYCNIKLLLLFCVIYGHMIEPNIASSEIAMFLYKLIYTIHMPLFLFLSGLFIKGKGQALSQAKHALLLYAACQSAVFLLSRLFHYTGISFFRPYWHLWYLFSLGCMAALAYCWYWLIQICPGLGHPVAKCALLLLSVSLACMAGNISMIGRDFSLSRTIVFLPYFLAGMFCPANICWKRYRLPGLVAFLYFLVVFYLQGRKIPAAFYYQAEPYGTLPLQQGIYFRLLCYMMAICFGFFLLSFAAGRRFPFSKIGANTLEIYLFHAPIVKALGAITSFASVPAGTIICLAPLTTAYIVFLLYKTFQWKNPMYAIRFMGG